MATGYSPAQFQAILHGLGYLPTWTAKTASLGADGLSDRLLLTAIRAFQQDYQLSLTGQLDDATQERARQLIRNLQHSLNLVAQAQLPLSGFYSMATIRAIEVFQRQRGLAVTGTVSVVLRRTLEQEVKQQLRSQMSAALHSTPQSGASMARSVEPCSAEC